MMSLNYMHRNALVFFIVFGFLVRVLIACFGGLGCLVDDTFYSLDIARSIAIGEGVKYHGIVTNGFQPLHVFLCAPFFSLLTDASALKAILLSMAVVNSATAIFIFLVLKKMGFPLGGVLGAVIWSLSPYVIINGMNGLETPLAPFMLAISFYYFLHAIHGRMVVSVRKWVLMGAILGGAILARIDMGFWAVAIALGILITETEMTFCDRVKGLLFLSISAFFVVLPWFAYNIIVFGSPIPGSGQAVRFISLAFGYNHWGMRGVYFPINQVPLHYYALSLMSSVREILVSIDTVSALFTFRGQCFLWALLAVLVRKRLAHFVREYPALFIFPVFMIFVYSFWVFGQWFYPRYYYSVIFVAILVVGVISGDRGESFLIKGRGFVLSVSLIVIALGLSALNVVSLYSGRELSTAIDHPERDRAMAADVAFSDLVKSHIPPGEKVGAFQSGILGYSARSYKVVNLDGVVNQTALKAMKENRMAEYVAVQGINWMIDWDWIIDALYTKRAGKPDMLSEWILVEKVGITTLYRRKSK